jgi:cysteine-rich repeat protein
LLAAAMLLAPMSAASASTPAVTVRLTASSHTAGAKAVLTVAVHARAKLRNATLVAVVPTNWPPASARQLRLKAPHCSHAGVPRTSRRGVTVAHLSCRAGASLALSLRGHLPTAAGQYTFIATVSSGPRKHRTTTSTRLPFTVRPAAADHLVLSPAASTVAYGATRGFHAYAADRFGNRRADVTRQTTFAMSPDGRCAGSVCGAGAHADSGGARHRVAGTLGALRGSADLLVTPRHVTVAAEPASRVYGASDPGFTYRVTGLATSDHALAGITCAVVGAHVGVGTYPLTCQGGSDRDYVVDRYEASTLTVTPAPLTVPVTGQQTYGGAPTYDADLAASGLVNGDDATVVAGTLACQTTATATSQVGPYPISDCSGLSSPNYTISYTYGALDVTPQPVTVTADDKTMIAGDADPIYTYTTAPAGLQLAGVTCGVSGGHTAAGSYPITCTPTTDSDYSETTNNPGTLTVQTAQGAAAVCGDGKLEAGEACDDGNTVDEASCPYGDATCNACNSTCTAVLNLTGPYCGDGVQEAGEACDDGNTVNETSCPYGDATCSACNATCSAPLQLTGGYCGDGTRQAGEVCDDGNNVTQTSCPVGQATCMACNASCSASLALTGGG